MKQVLLRTWNFQGEDDDGMLWSGIPWLACLTFEVGDYGPQGGRKMPSLESVIDVIVSVDCHLCDAYRDAIAEEDGSEQEDVDGWWKEGWRGSDNAERTYCPTHQGEACAKGKEHKTMLADAVCTRVMITCAACDRVDTEEQRGVENLRSKMADTWEQEGWRLVGDCARCPDCAPRPRQEATPTDVSLEDLRAGQHEAERVDIAPEEVEAPEASLEDLLRDESEEGTQAAA